MDDNKIALVVLSVLVLVGLAGFFSTNSTGSFTAAGDWIQLQPYEACQRIGCTFTEGFNMAQPYREIEGTPTALCECPSGLVSPQTKNVYVPLVQLKEKQTKIPKIV